jgi:hypothetical protein
MTFFNPSEPMFCPKQHQLDVQDRRGLWNLRLHLGICRLEMMYTRVDQVFLLWGAICAVIFATAQIAPFDWLVQAGVWSALTLAGATLTCALAWYWCRVERLLWLIWYWLGLLVIGLVLTAAAILVPLPELLLNLSPLWLFVCALGYLGTGVGLRSRAMLLAAGVHLVAIVPIGASDLPYLWTGLVVAGTLFGFAGTQWDMRLPIHYRLSEAELEFNARQHRQRQARE